MLCGNEVDAGDISASYSPLAIVEVRAPAACWTKSARRHNCDPKKLKLDRPHSLFWPPVTAGPLGAAGVFANASQQGG